MEKLFEEKPEKFVTFLSCATLLQLLSNNMLWKGLKIFASLTFAYRIAQAAAFQLRQRDAASNVICAKQG